MGTTSDSDLDVVLVRACLAGILGISLIQVDSRADQRHHGRPPGFTERGLRAEACIGGDELPQQ